MKLKKAMGLLLALTLSTGVFASVGTNMKAIADEIKTPPQKASSVVTFDRENAKLHLPVTYEQYLPLENPSYIALNEDYIAVADNSSMYVYDREAGRYDAYSHEVSGTKVSISKIQFTDDGELYFRDINNLYKYNFETGEAEIVNNMGNYTFLIQGGYLYMAHASLIGSGSVDFSYVPVNNISLDNRAFLVQDLKANDPHMAYENGTLYCIINNNTVSAYDGETHEYLGDGKLDNSREQISGLKFVCAYGDEFFYTVNGAGNTPNGLYRTDKAGNAKCIAEGDGYSSITSYGGYLYCIQGKTIRKLSVTENSVEVTGYEIADSSDSPHRLSNSVKKKKEPDTGAGTGADEEDDGRPENAGETVRTKEILAIADIDNKRISVYNRLEKSYTTINCIDENGEPFYPEHIAIGKEETVVKANGDVVTSNKIAVSNGNKIYEYTFERHSLFPEENGVTDKNPVPFATDNEKNKVTGMTYVYGVCYYITGNNGYGSTNTNSEFSFSVAGKAPTAITSDVYGTIYVAFNDNRDIGIFTEASFLENGAKSDNLKRLSAEKPASITADYEGNIWYLDEEGNLHCNDLNGNDEVKAEIDGNDFVYTGKKSSDYPTSFALCFEDDEIYFCFQNYVVKTNAFALESLPSLNKITAGEAKEKTFKLADSNNLFVKVPEGSVGFEIDLYALKTGDSELTCGGKYFPYVSYFRSTGVKEGKDILPRRGVLLYEPQDEDGFYVVALYNVNAHSFTANLFKKSKEYIKNYGEDEKHFEEASDTAYVSSSVSLCSAPSLFIAPDGQRLSPLSDYLLNRGSSVNVLGFAEGEDREYAFVEVVSRERSVRKGYIPRSYLTKNDPLGITDQTYKLGHLRSDAGIILKGENGEELKITEKTEAKLYKNEDGTYTAVVEKDGVVYSNVVLSDQISRGETDALRISLIVILSVLALVIIGGYAFLMFPKKKKK